MNRKIFLILAFGLIACSSSRTGTDSFESRISDIRRQQADQGATITQLQEDLRILTGKLEEIEFKQKNTLPANNSFSQHSAIQPSLPAGPTTITPIARPASPLTSSDTPPAIVPLAELENDEAMAKHLDSQVSQVFRDALYFVRRGEFRQASSMLDQVISIANGKEGHAQSLFWKGISSDGIGNNKEALEAYSLLIKQYPGLERTRLALLRLSSVFIRLGDTATAKLTLEKLIAENPESKEANQARAKLKDLS
jgi:TolA-binding protein